MSCAATAVIMDVITLTPVKFHVHATDDICKVRRDLIYDMICLLTAIGLTPGGSSTVHIYTQTIHRTRQNRTYITIRIHNLLN